jgi:uncharacterized membrane protein
VLPVLGLCFLLALLTTGLLVADFRNPPDLVLFIGRFHPLIVHFPIGLIVLAALMEGVATFYRPLRRLRSAISFVLFLGAFSAVVAVIAGYFLSLEGGFDPVLLERHMWLGIGVAAMAVAAVVLQALSRRRRSRYLARAYAGMLVAAVGTLVLAGHLGGTLTRGEGYLTQHLPDSVRGVLGTGQVRAFRSGITDIDSAHVYQDLVRPVLVSRCVACHSESKLSGGLRLDTSEGLMKGGEHGAVVVAGNPDESELLLRVVLPPSAKGAMPPNGVRPLDVGETEVIRWWIAHGASFEQRVADIEEIPTSVATLFNRVAPPRPERRPTLYALDAPPADPHAIALLRSAGYGIGPVAQDVRLLEVSAVNLRSTLRDNELQALLAVAEQVAWLDLSGTRVGDEGIMVLERMPNLTRLRLDRTGVSDLGLRHLSGLKNLEYLNLFGTAVSDAGLEHLTELDRLRALYLWQTAVTDQGVEKLQMRHPGLRIDLGQPR